MKNKVKAFFESRDYVERVHAITLSIGDETWEGVWCIMDGLTVFYLVGELPADWDEENKLYFTLGDINFRVRSHMQDFENLEGRYREFHPFGNNWVLGEMEDFPTGLYPREMKVS
jgi:hypothetical protein